MKAGIFSIACISLMQLAASQPHAQVHHHAKRDPAVVPNVVANAQAQIEEIIVWVNANRVPVSTQTIYKTQIPTKAPAPPPKPAPAPAHHSTPAPAPPPAPKPAPPVHSSTPPSTGGGLAASGPGFKSAISYSPYNADNSCKSTSQVASDIRMITGYQVIRLYGTDCNQVANVVAATQGKMSLFLGIYDITSVQAEVATIAAAVKGNWALVNTVNVGNELVNSGAASVGQVTAAIGTARAALKQAGYHGPVVTVDTMVAMKNNPALCTASDFCAINCHAFFDGNVLPSGAGAFVKMWTGMVSQAAGGKTVVVTESGWPTQGQANNKAVPSPQNQKLAIASLKAAFGTNMILYSAFNDLWKKDSGSTFGAEKFWGLMGNAPN